MIIFYYFLLDDKNSNKFEGVKKTLYVKKTTVGKRIIILLNILELCCLLGKNIYIQTISKS